MVTVTVTEVTEGNTMLPSQKLFMVKSRKPWAQPTWKYLQPKIKRFALKYGMVPDDELREAFRLWDEERGKHGTKYVRRARRIRIAREKSWKIQSKMRRRKT